MKAAVLSGIEKLEFTEVDRPACNSGEVLLKLEACAICKTDTKMFHSGHRDLKLPRILGHELAGTIIAVGKGIHKFDVGDRVQVAPGLPCDGCPLWIRGVPQM